MSRRGEPIGECFCEPFEPDPQNTDERGRPVCFKCQGVPPRRPRVVKATCDDAGPCTFHEDGGPPTDPCIGMCDVEGCGVMEDRGLWYVEAGPGIVESPTALCATHLLELVRGHVLKG